MALTVFQKFGMIGIDKEATIWVLNWAKYQNEPGLAKIRERSLMQLEDRSPDEIRSSCTRQASMQTLGASLEQ
jgi:hypothetical protein